MKIYIVQIDMSCDNDGTQWENCDRAFQTRDAAEADVEFMVREYGIDRRGLHIEELELV